jgi:hypothetical protein
MPYSDRLSISTAPRDGTLIRFWCRSEAASVVGYWSKTFIGWVAYHEPIPLIRHNVTGWGARRAFIDLDQWAPVQFCVTGSSQRARIARCWWFHGFWSVSIGGIEC